MTTSEFEHLVHLIFHEILDVLVHLIIYQLLNEPDVQSAFLSDGAE